VKAKLNLSNVQEKYPWATNYSRFIDWVVGNAVNQCGSANWERGYSAPAVFVVKDISEVFRLRNKYLVEQWDIVIIPSMRKMMCLRDIPPQDPATWTTARPDMSWDAWDAKQPILCPFCNGPKTSFTSKCLNCGA
jgi:hypothetical protein